MSDLQQRATTGEEVRVDYTAIEKTLADLWRVEKQDDEQAVTRAALWNVVAHTSTSEHHAHASETLSRAAAAVPQRTIVVRANPAAEPEMTSWLSANCHILGGGKQVCSEEIAIVAGGSLVERVPPLVNALLIPDMPVAVWWVGDLPNEQVDYVDALLDPADRLIVDSVHFDRPDDLVLVQRIAQKTTTAPADLNWVRLEEWRTATATVFDPPDMRQRIGRIRQVRVVNRVRDAAYFGESVDSILYTAWIGAQLGHHVDESGKVEGAIGTIDYRFDHASESGTGLMRVDFTFDDGSSATILREEERGVLATSVEGDIQLSESVTRTVARRADDLIVRQLKQSEGDRLLLKVLPHAISLAKRMV